MRYAFIEAIRDLWGGHPDEEGFTEYARGQVQLACYLLGLDSDEARDAFTEDVLRAWDNDN
jgi:hypothetical protein